MNKPGQNVNPFNVDKLKMINQKTNVLFKEGLWLDTKLKYAESIQVTFLFLNPPRQRFNQSGENLDDLFQIGCIGMIKAIDNFDISLNVQFSTYAVPMIIGEIKRFLRDNSTIRVSRSLKDTAYKAITTRENLMKKNLKEPSITEIAEEIGISKADIVIALEAVTPSISLYEPVFNDGGDTLYVIDQVKDKKNTEDRWVRNIALKEAINRLSPRERQIITLRFFDCRTQTEVAKDLGISQAQVSRLEKCALRDMKRHLC